MFDLHLAISINISLYITSFKPSFSCQLSTVDSQIYISSPVITRVPDLYIHLLVFNINMFEGTQDENQAPGHCPHLVLVQWCPPQRRVSPSIQLISHKSEAPLTPPSHFSTNPSQRPPILLVKHLFLCDLCPIFTVLSLVQAIVICLVQYFIVF